MNHLAAVDQLAATARDEVPKLVASSRDLLTCLGDRDAALAALTTRFMCLPHNGVAALAADALLRLAEETR